MSKQKRSEDFDLIQRAKRDMDAFGAIYEKYFVAVFRFVYHKVGDKELASDLTSQTFMKAMLHLPRYNDKGKPILAWFFMIAMNEVRMHFRSSTEKRTIALEDDHLRALATGAELSTDDHTIDHLVSALDHLEEDALHLIEMRYFDGLSFAMIAEVYRAKEPAVKMRVYRILKELRSTIEKQQGTR